MLFDGFEGGDESGGGISSEEVPGVEAGEVLKGTEELVAANYRSANMVSKASRAVAGCCRARQYQ